jgi:hypothetical protein
LFIANELCVTAIRLLKRNRQTIYVGVAAPDYFAAILNVDYVFSDFLSTKQTAITTIITLNEDCVKIKKTGALCT